MIPLLYNMLTSTKNYEKMSGVGGLGDLVEFDGVMSYDSQSQLYDTTATFPERVLGMKIQRQLANDDLTHIMSGKPANMAISVARTREKLGVSIFNNAFTGTAGGDSVSLCNASHPYSPENPNVQSNTGISPLTPASIEAVRITGMTDIKNDRGEILDIDFDRILCHPRNHEKAWEIIESKGKVNTADNNKNFHYGRYELSIWSRLMNNFPWFMIDSKLCKTFLIWWDRIKPEFNYDRDFDSYQAKWSVYMRCQPQFAGWQWIFGQDATG
jgi:hypothetical protein